MGRSAVGARPTSCSFGVLALALLAALLPGRLAMAEPLEFWTNGTDQARLGIGNHSGTTPATLTVYEYLNADVTNTLRDSNFLTLRGAFWNGTSTAVTGRIFLDVLSTGPTYGLAFQTNGTTRMYINETGSVGVGTTSPSGLFDVSVPGTLNRFYVGNDNNVGVELRSGTTLGLPYIDFSNDNASDYDGRIILTGDNYLFVDGANLGIGNNAPGVDLAILNATSPSIHLRRDATNEWYFTATPAGADRLGFRVGGNADANERMTILSGGNIGIGSIGPTNKLQVEGTGNQTLEVRTNTSGDARMQMHNSGANIFGFRALRAGDGMTIEDFSTGSENEIARFMNSGRVGIGTTDPQGLLHIQSGTPEIFRYG
jgi:hypothetical protein